MASCRTCGGSGVLEIRNPKNPSETKTITCPGCGGRG